jgi:hypothetical protein
MQASIRVEHHTDKGFRASYSISIRHKHSDTDDLNQRPIVTDLKVWVCGYKGP